MEQRQGQEQEPFIDRLCAEVRTLAMHGVQGVEAADIPCLVQVTELLHGAPFDAAKLEFVLHHALSGLEPSDQTGMTVLFRISDEDWAKQEERFDEAARHLLTIRDRVPYKNGESLRKTEDAIESRARNVTAKLIEAVEQKAPGWSLAPSDEAVEQDAAPPDESVEQSAPTPHRRVVVWLATTVAAIAVLGATLALALSTGTPATHGQTQPHGHAFTYPDVPNPYAPIRKPYDFDKDNGNSNCDDPTNPAADYGRCGAIGRIPVFNSYVNAPDFGDERRFVKAIAPDSADADKSKFYDVVVGATDGSGETTVAIYVDNMARPDPDVPDRTTARNTRVHVVVPADTGRILNVVGSISADNAVTVEDALTIMDRRPFHLEYVPGSAKLLRPSDGQVYPLSDDVVGSSGVLIGSTELDGEVPACSDLCPLMVTLSVRAVAMQRGA